MPNDKPVIIETIDGEEYDIEQTDNSVKPEDGDQSAVDQMPVLDADEEADE
jgi:hypothetical protein